MSCFPCLSVSLTAFVLWALLAAGAYAQTDPLPSWNDGPAKQAIVEFVQTTTTQGSAKFVPPAERIATFDQDGTLWVEHPMYSQVMYFLERVPALVKAKPELAKVEPFKTVLSGNREAIAKLPTQDLVKIAAATLTGMSVDEFNAEVKKWLATAKDPRWKRPVYRADLPADAGGPAVPARERLQDLHRHRWRAGLRARVRRGGLRHPARAGGRHRRRTKYGYDKNGKPFLTKEPKLLLNDNNAGKPEGIHLMIGRRPHAAFGNSTGDRQMLEYTKAGDGARLSMLVLHDDATREYAYGPAHRPPRHQGRHVHPGAV